MSADEEGVGWLAMGLALALLWLAVRGVDATPVRVAEELVIGLGVGLPLAYVGRRFYLHQTAAGKALLSRLSQPEVEEIVDRWGLPARTENTITDPEELYEELDVIRDRGYSFNREEQLQGVKAVGVPVTGPDDRVIGAFSVASPANRMSDEWFEEKLPSIALGVTNEFELEYSLS